MWCKGTSVSHQNSAKDKLSPFGTFITPSTADFRTDKKGNLWHIRHTYKADSMAQVVECLSSMVESLNSFPVSQKRRCAYLKYLFLKVWLNIWYFWRKY
jgi:hypothetical protein